MSNRIIVYISRCDAQILKVLNFQSWSWFPKSLVRHHCSPRPPHRSHFSTRTFGLEPPAVQVLCNIDLRKSRNSLLRYERTEEVVVSPTFTTFPSHITLPYHKHPEELEWWCTYLQQKMSRCRTDLNGMYHALTLSKWFCVTALQWCWGKWKTATLPGSTIIDYYTGCFC